MGQAVGLRALLPSLRPLCLSGERLTLKALTPLRRLRLDDLGDVLGVNQDPASGLAEVEDLAATPRRAEIPRFLEDVLLAVAQAHREGTEGLSLDEFSDRCRFHAGHGSAAPISPQREDRGKRVRTRHVGDAAGQAAGTSPQEAAFRWTTNE